MNSVISPLFFLLMSFFPFSLLASAPINTEDFPPGRIMMHELVPDHAPDRATLKSLRQEEKKLLRTEKKIAGLQKIFQSKKGQKALNLFQDPVNRWLWLWLLTWGAGILLSVIAGGSVASGIGIVWFSLFVIGSISLVIWLVKRFQ